MDESRKSSLIVVAAVVLATAGVELALRLAMPPWALLDPRTDAYWAARLRTPGASRQPAIGGDIEFDARLGWRMKRYYVSDEAQHDARGFRIHGKAAKRRTATRILMIGDSFTYGHGVKGNETTAAQLQLLAGAEVINAGVNSFGVDQAFLMWELEGRRDPVNVVVLGYFVDDFYRNLLSVREAPKPHLLRENLSYRFSNIPVPTIEAWLAGSESLRSLRILDGSDFLMRKARTLLGRHDDIHAEAAARSEYLLLALRDSVAAAGARLVVTLIPHCWRESPDAFWAVASIRNTTGNGSIPLLDLIEIDRVPDPFGDRCHWNAYGHRVAAERLVAMLGAYGWLAGH